MRDMGPAEGNLLERTSPETVTSLARRAATEREAVRREVLWRLEEPDLNPFLRRSLELILARICLDHAEFAEALRYARGVLEWAIPEGEHQLAGQAHNNLGLTYWKLGDLPQALESFSAALQEAQTAGDPELELRSSMNLGLVHSGQKKWDAAAHIYRRAYAIAQERDDRRILGVTAHNLGCTLWERDGASDEALALTRQAYQFKLDFREPATLAYTANNLVGILRDRGEWAEAHAALAESARWVEASDMPGTRFYHALNSGCLHLALENPQRDDERGFAEMRGALSLAQEAAMLDEEGKAYEYLARAYAERGAHKEAHEALLEYSKVRDKYMAAQTSQRIENLRSAFEIQRLEREHRIEAARRREVEQLNRRLSELAEGKDRLLRLIGHDLRGHLSGILGMADLILVTRPPETESREFIGDIVSAARATLSLLEEILDYGRLIASGSSTFAEIDLVTAACEVADRVRAQFRRKEQSLELECVEDLLTVTTELMGFERVLENLLTNASKFCPPGSRTTLRIEAWEDQIRVAVIDRGPGIAPMDRSRLFHPGQRLTSRPTGNETSAGVGLYLAREIAEKIGATLHFEETPGGGATFVIAFARNSD